MELGEVTWMPAASKTHAPRVFPSFQRLVALLCLQVVHRCAGSSMNFPLSPEPSAAMARRRLLRRLGTLLLLGWLLLPDAPAAASPPAPVLILISRNPGDPWAVAELDGMQRVLRAAKPAVAAVVEYMDVQGNPRPGDEAELADYYRDKFAQQQFRVVLTADLPALDFVLNYRDTLFPEAQVAFCGISKVELQARTGRPWLTGVIENADPAASVLLALALQPQLKRLIILEDSTRSGEGNKKRIEQDLPEETKRVRLELARTDTARELFAKVENLPSDTAVLLTRSQVARRMGPELLARCPVPIYGQRTPNHLGAMLGGAVIDGERHGEAAARLGLRLLAGEVASSIPPVADIAPRIVVDYAQMERFKLPFSSLPPGAEILNRPRRVWEEYPRATTVALCTLGFLSILTGGLAWALAQKRRNADALKNSLSLLHATLDASNEGVLVVDMKGKVSGFNRRFADLWEVPRSLIEQRDDAALLAFVLDQLREPDAFLQRVQELYATPAAESFEVIEFRDGRVFERRSRPHELDGTIIGRVWTFSDITARREAEETHRRLEAKMAHTQRLEALGTLAGGIAHDFNNLLTAILGYAQLAHESLPSDHPVYSDLEGVLAASHRARDLVKQILTFSRKSPLERRPIPLETVVRDASRLLRATIPAAVEIHCEIGAAGGTVLADSSQVHQAILNLGTNAAHAMRGQPGTITMQLDRVEVGRELLAKYPQLEEGEYLCVTVSDTGHGMDAATLRRVFDPFFTTKAPGEGTGLGLAVVHGIMQNHEGAVTIESKPGEGTAARLYFPIVDAPAEGEVKPVPPIPKIHTGRVLVVDDEKLVLGVAQQMLERLGFRVTACSSPIAALELLHADPASCSALLTDLNMPQMTGTELAAQVRQTWPDIAIVLATGFLGDGTVEQRATKIGIEEIITKPYSSATLGGAVARAIEKARARRPQEASPVQ